MEQANAIKRFQRKQRFQRKYDPFSNTYNLGWRDNLNFNYLGNQQQAAPNANFTRPLVSLNQSLNNHIKLDHNLSFKTRGYL